MEYFERGAALVQLLPLTFITVNWFLSLFLAPKANNYFRLDLKQLWQDTQPFLKTQWPFVAICLVGSSVTRVQLVNDLKSEPEFTMAIIMASVVSAGILPILKLFYVAYLAAPKYPGRLASIGIWSVFVYVFSEGLLASFSNLGLFLLIAPGLILLIRTCLFLPIYAIEGNHPIAALQKSWALTAGKYWLVSRYMGLPILLLGVLGIVPQLAAAAKVYGNQSVQFYWPIFAAVGAASLVVSLIVGGLSYKLYDRLTSPEAST